MVSILNQPRRPDASIISRRMSSGNLDRVSILIQPAGRMQGVIDRFQPLSDDIMGFNPHPARRPDARWETVLAVRHQAETMFQSSSSPKTGCKVAALGQITCRARHFGFNPHPARRPDASALCNVMALSLSIHASFNPHPARRPDARASTATIWWKLSPKVPGFNPHPARRPDASPAAQESPVQVPIKGVSILIQPEDRMQGDLDQPLLRTLKLFQSSSSPKTGCKALSMSFLLVDCEPP